MSGKVPVLEEGKENYFGFFICFAAGVVLGCLFLNLFWKWSSYVVLHERRYAMELLAEDKNFLHFWKVTTGILASSMYVFLIGFGFTAHGTVFSNLFSFLSGVWTGAFLTESVLAGGLAFSGMILQKLFPEGGFYTAAVLFGLGWQNNMSTGSDKGRGRTGKRSGLKCWKKLVFSLFFFCLWVGSLIYVNLR